MGLGVSRSVAIRSAVFRLRMSGCTEEAELLEQRLEKPPKPPKKPKASKPEPPAEPTDTEE